ncbi:hypothetical protein DSLPV1_210 [Dishui lake phycodnavirus 1]|uniref:hypothetical protein n=1 Tax=Dishui lake phycodnavirus 1 TaxID=2079134 RepID=UPI000CD6A156|nr:hypothetical protein C5Y57_gp188 [Dishui lake phycodnavirus 1]AUT19181.1 hypothetical protein DSLPV1_210 [Dishui lake phycodnavirus 1]
MLSLSIRAPTATAVKIGRNVVTHIVTPLAILYTVLYASEYVYYSQKCSRIDRIGTPICEYSHKLFVKTRSLLFTFLDNGLTTIGAVALSKFVNLSPNKTESPGRTSPPSFTMPTSSTVVPTDPLGLPPFNIS